MQLTYNLILAVFLKYYYPTVPKNKIGTALISVIDPTYKRANDETLNREFLVGKINVPQYLFDASNPITYKSLVANASMFKKTFNNETINNKIKFVLSKMLELDKSLDNETQLIKPGYLLKTINSLNFFDFSINLIMLIVYHSSHPKNVPVDTSIIDEIHTIGVTEVPHLFLEIDKNYLLKYDNYYTQAVEDIKKVKTILYRNEAVDFYSIYVSPDIKTTVKFYRDENFRELKGSDSTTNTYLSTFGKYTSVIAPGGFGKSMFLKHLFLCDSLDKVTENRKSHLIPIFLEVRSFIQEEANLEEMLFEEVNKYLTQLNFEQFKSDLKKGGFLLLFDGLDEIKNSQLQSFFSELNKMTEKYPNNNYVVSSRPSEKGECLKKFKIVNLQGFKLDRAKRMIIKLPNLDEEKQNSFCELLENGAYKKHSEIASNPLMLTLMLMVYMIKGKLPTKTYEFYEEAYNVLYFDHDNIKGFTERVYHTKLKRLQLSKVISEFCYLTTEGQDYEFTETDIIQILNESSYADLVSPDDFIKDLDENLNLIYLEGGKYKFVHRSFQEYFAANHCRMMKQTDYLKLPKWFNSLTKNRKYPGSEIIYFNLNGLGVFKLLYDMNKERFIDGIVVPTLSKVIKGTTLEDYLFYLKEVYSNIEYGFEVAMEPKNHIIKLIMEVFIGNYFCDFTRYEHIDYKKYRDGGYWMIGDGCNEPIEKVNRIDLDSILIQMSKEEREAYIAENRIDINNPNVFDYKIPVEDIIKDQEKFSELIKLINDDKHELKRLFKKLAELIEKNS